MPLSLFILISSGAPFAFANAKGQGLLFLFPLLCVATLHYRDRGAEAREQQKGIKIRKE
jgi:hypothetical protein